MKNTLLHGVIATSVAVLAIASSAFSAPNDLLGDSYDRENIYQRSITIGPNTKHVNVNAGEVIRFVDQASGKTFIWKFGTTAKGDGGYRFDLATVAPPGTLNRPIIAYVASDLRDMF